MTTSRTLIEAAASLLDAGGEQAVTLRAVGHAAGLSHNAPYKHFASRSALLAAVVIADLEMLAAMLRAIKASGGLPSTRLRTALTKVVEYSEQHPARYRLLFDDPEIAAVGGDVRRAAMANFDAFAALLADCQEAGELPAMPVGALTGVLFAAVHGLISLRASGRMEPAKGLTGVMPAIETLLALIAPQPALKPTRRRGRPAT